MQRGQRMGPYSPTDASAGEVETGAGLGDADQVQVGRLARLDGADAHQRAEVTAVQGFAGNTNQNVEWDSR